MSLRFLLVALIGLLTMALGAGPPDESPAPAPEVTVTGRLTCASCGLRMADECQTALKATEGGKDVVYFLVPNDITRPLHKFICRKSIDGVRVTGTTTERNGQKWIDATSIVPPQPNH